MLIYRSNSGKVLKGACLSAYIQYFGLCNNLLLSTANAIINYLFEKTVQQERVTRSSSEVCTNSQEADYDTSFIACHISKVIS